MADEPTEYRQPKFRAPRGSTELLLVRHGESAPARPDAPFALRDGHGDPPLAPEGRWQAEQVGFRLAQEQVDAIYVSSLRRTHETAAPLAARLDLVPIEEPDLREIHLGEWEGGLYRKMAAEGHPLIIKAFEEEEWGMIPGAETDQALRARVMPVIDRIVTDHADRRVVVVVHGGVIGAILSAATGSRRWAFNVADNGSISHLVGHDGRWILRRFNDTGHLAGELSTETDPPT